MVKTLDLKFCKLVYSEKDNSINKEKDLILKAYQLNKQFFKTTISKFEIKLIYSRKDFNKLWGRKTERFVSAFARNNKIVIFSYAIFDKETKWKQKDFLSTLIHEINHLFYTKLRNHEYKPLWLSEGLAVFMQHNQKRFSYKKRLKKIKRV